MDYPEEINWDSPDMEVRMGIIMHNSDKEEGQCMLRISVVDKDGQLMMPLELTAPQLQALMCANAYFGDLLSETIKIGSEAEGLAQEGGFTLE